MMRVSLLKLAVLVLMAAPATAWFFHVVGFSPALERWRVVIAELPFGPYLMLILGLVLTLGARDTLRWARWQGAIESLRRHAVGKSLKRAGAGESLKPKGERRSWGLRTVAAVPLAALLLAAGVVLLDLSSFRPISDTIIVFLHHLFFAELSPDWFPTAALVLALGSLWVAAGPGISRRERHYKTYHLEVFSPLRSRLCRKRLTLRYLPFLRGQKLAEFNRYTVFAGQIISVFEGKEQTWHLTYDERTMKDRGERTLLSPRQFHAFLNALSMLEKRADQAGTSGPISHDILLDVVKELKLAELADKGREPLLHDLEGREVATIARAFSRSKYHDVLSLDVSDAASPRGRQAFEKRLEALVLQVNLARLRSVGTFDIDIFRVGRERMVKILKFVVNNQESIRRTYDEYEHPSPRRSIIYATVRGPAGEHHDGPDHHDSDDTHLGDHTDLEVADAGVTADAEGHGDHDHDHDHYQAGGAAALDRVEQIRPSIMMRFWLKRFGRIYHLQLGRESYQIVTEWLASFGVVPVTGWRPFRVSLVRDSDGELVARRYQSLGDFIPHLLSILWLGDEYSHCEILKPECEHNDKLPLALLALDMFEASEYRYRKRILKTRLVEEEIRQHPER